MSLDSMKEIFDRMEQEGKPFWEIVLETDMEERQVTRSQSMAKMLLTWQAMADAADNYTGRRRSVSGLVGGDGMKMRQYCFRDEAMSGGYISEVITEALSMAESNACMCRIVAAPTAGACGVLPAVLLPLCRYEELSQHQLLEALYVASGIGAVIGHEIGHGFDDQGSQYDGDGKLNDWWTEEDKANFKALTQKLIDQYNEFVPTQLAEKYSDDPSKAPHVNGALTIGENIGDLSGVNIALKAYAFALDEAAGRGKDGSTEAIEAALADAPEIDGFTGLQRFFLSYASIWRTKNRDELAEQYLQIDPHSPAECRTNGIARNVDLFHKAFGVQPGDGMWLAPEQRVRIW